MADDKDRGFYAKFYAPLRTDGRSEPGEKHHGCEYFVLDLTHDPHALAAIQAYADSCKYDYPLLTVDLLQRAGELADRLKGDET